MRRLALSVVVMLCAGLAFPASSFRFQRTDKAATRIGSHSGQLPSDTLLLGLTAKLGQPNWVKASCCESAPLVLWPCVEWKSTALVVSYRHLPPGRTLQSQHILQRI